MTILNPTPLEKQLLQMNLSKGVNERVRPETSDPSATLTAVDNLYQDQDGSLVKRQGTTRTLTSDASGTGTFPAYVRKILNLVNGWGVIADGGKLLHKQDTQGTFRSKQKLMDFSCTSGLITGSSGTAGVRGPTATEGNVFSIASCSTHDAMTTFGSPTGGVSGSGCRLILCERDSGVEYLWHLDQIFGAQVAKAKVVFVNDRYLHVYVEISSTYVKSFAIDVQSPLVTPSVHTVYTSGGMCFFTDACGSNSLGAFVVVSDSFITSSVLINTVDTTAAAATSAVLGSPHTYTRLSLNETLNHVWVQAPSTSDARYLTLDATTLAVVNATWLSTKPGSIFSVAPDDTLKIIYSNIASTFGSGTNTRQDIYTMAATGSGTVPTAVGSFMGWNIVSYPFYMSGSGKWYAHAVKEDTTNSLATHAIVDLSSHTPFVSNVAGLTVPPGSVRIACMLEPYVGVRRAGGEPLTSITAADNGYRWRIESQDGYEVSAYVPYAVAQRVEGEGFVRLRLNDSTAMGSANFSGSTYIAHGGLNGYDGSALVEQGFADMPVFGSAVSAVAGNLSGAYKYVAVYRHVDSNGVSSYSRTYGPVSATNVAGATGKNVITAQPHAVTNRDDGIGYCAPFVELYRTIAGGTQYYLCASSQSSAVTAETPSIQQMARNTSTGLITVTDNMSDATLATQAPMYRQPGTGNGPVDRYAAPGTKIVVQHNDRLFCTDAYGQRVYYSSFFVDGEAAWFNPAFNFYVHDGSGPITALVSMDGRLIVFKSDRIFVVDGDGPGEAGPTGNEFSPPQALALQYGCIDHRSVVVCPDGIIYRSARGFELLTRSLQVKWIGDRVQTTAASYPVTTGACLDSIGLVHITVAASEGANGVGAAAGVELIYDTTADAWSRFVSTDNTSVYGTCRQHVALVSDSGTSKVVYANDSGVEVSTDSSSLDVGQYYVPFVLSTGWLRGGQQVRQRISEILFLAKKRAGSNHAISISVAYDFVDSYTQVHVWEPDEINSLSIEELGLPVTTPETLAIRVLIQDQEPADTGTYPVGAGAGCDVLGISTEIVLKSGAPKANRGSVAYISPTVSGLCETSGTEDGGESVTIFGRGFTGVTGVFFGGVAATGVSAQSDTMITCITPVHAVGDVSVMVTTPGGTDAKDAAYEYTPAGAVVFDETVGATLYLRDYSAPTGGTWNSLVAGKVFNALVGDTLINTPPGPYTPPTIGSNFGAHSSANFAGGAYGLAGQGCSILAACISPLEYMIDIILEMNNLPVSDPGAGAPYTGYQIISSSNFFGVGVGPSGVFAWHYDGGFTGVTPFVPVSAGTKYNIQVWHDGSTLRIRVNGGSSVSVAAGPMVYTLGLCSPMQVGIGQVAPCIDGMVARVLSYPSQKDATFRDNLYAQAQDEYGV